jgi:hypothetical protein
VHPDLPRRRQRRSQDSPATARLLQNLTEHYYCGKAGCACQADPPRPHGPYWQWTRKVAGKTITRRLTPNQTERYRPWIENDRRIRELLTRLEALGIAHLEADQPRTQKPD